MFFLASYMCVRCHLRICDTRASVHLVNSSQHTPTTVLKTEHLAGFGLDFRVAYGAKCAEKTRPLLARNTALSCVCVCVQMRKQRSECVVLQQTECQVIWHHRIIHVCGALFALPFRRLLIGASISINQRGTPHGITRGRQPNADASHAYINHNCTHTHGTRRV